MHCILKVKIESFAINFQICKCNLFINNEMKSIFFHNFFLTSFSYPDKRTQSYGKWVIYNLTSLCYIMNLILHYRGWSRSTCHGHKPHPGSSCGPKLSAVRISHAPSGPSGHPGISCPRPTPSSRVTGPGSSAGSLQHSRGGPVR